MSARHLLASISLAALLAAACGQRGDPSNKPASSSSALASASVAPALTGSAPTAAAAVAQDAPGDPDHGRDLVGKLECSRCHIRGTGMPVEPTKACFRCHVDILAGRFRGPQNLQAQWHKRVADLADVPMLIGVGRFRRAWLTRFLTSPVDLRPRLGPTMPRLPISEKDARDIAAYLIKYDSENESTAKIEKPSYAGGSAEKGRALVEAKGCTTCHALDVDPPLAGAAADKKYERGALALAPDLRFARERLDPETIIAWVKSPRALKSDTLMPEFGLTEVEARDIATFLVTAKLTEPAKKAVPARLPVLTRPVRYDEVAEKVFRRTCWHCHGEPDYAAGDGGPGNTGGFGFKPRGVSFVDYSSANAGYTDDAGERHSLFEPTKDGTPRLLAALLARRDEEVGHAMPDLRGMPLGYPSLTAEDIQLVESWIAQGRLR